MTPINLGIGIIIASQVVSTYSTPLSKGVDLGRCLETWNQFMLFATDEEPVCMTRAVFDNFFDFHSRLCVSQNVHIGLLALR
jgi:hypothetical protein